MQLQPKGVLKYFEKVLVGLLRVQITLSVIGHHCHTALARFSRCEKIGMRSMGSSYGCSFAVL